MSRQLAAVALVCGLAFAGGAWSASSPPAADTGTEPIVRLSLEPAGPVELGTDSLLRVDVLVPTWFLAAPRFPEGFDLPGATVEAIRGSAQNLSEPIGGSTWAGLRRSYRIQPLNPGEFRLPELAVSLRYAAEGGRGALEHTARGQLAAPLRVRLPAAAAHLDPFIAAHRLHLAQRIERPERALGVGDAVRRTIVLDTDAGPVELPASAWRESAGARVYVDPPRTREERIDATARALLRREQSATWVFERAGRYELPPVDIEWWDIERRQVRRERLPAVALTVGPARSAALFALPAAVAELAPARGADWSGLRPFALVALAATLLGLIWRGRGWLRRAAARGGRWWHAALDSEGWRFRSLIRACRRHAAPEARDALQRWLDARAASAPGLNRWLLTQVPAPELAAALAELDAALYGRGAPVAWRGGALARELIRARRRLAARPVAKAAALAATLNP